MGWTNHPDHQQLFKYVFNVLSLFLIIVLKLFCRCTANLNTAQSMGRCTDSIISILYIYSAAKQ